MSHTKTPWFLSADDHGIIREGYRLGAMENKVDAAYLLQCVNQHEALVEALADILEELDDRYDGAPDSKVLWMGRHIQTIRAALAKVTP